MTKYTKNGFLFPSRNLRRINRVVENGGTHYTIFGYRHRYAKIMSEPEGANPLWTPPIGWVGFLARNEGKIQDMGI